MAETSPVSVSTTAVVVAIGEAADNKPSVTLSIEGDEVLLYLDTPAEARALAPVLFEEVAVTISIPTAKNGACR